MSERKPMTKEQILDAIKALLLASVECQRLAGCGNLPVNAEVIFAEEALILIQFAIGASTEMKKLNLFGPVEDQAILDFYETLVPGTKEKMKAVKDQIEGVMNGTKECNCPVCSAKPKAAGAKEETKQPVAAPKIPAKNLN